MNSKEGKASGGNVRLERQVRCRTKLPDLEIWKDEFARKFRQDWHPQAWITVEGKERLISRVRDCLSWDEVRNIAPVVYTPFK